MFGSREWLDQTPVSNRLKLLPPDTIIVHGACKGADNIAGYVAELLGFEVRRYPADWERYGKGAGPIRNQQMLTEEHASADGTYIDLALCFHVREDLGTGSRDMMSRLEKAIPAIPHETILRVKKSIDLWL